MNNMRGLDVDTPIRIKNISTDTRLRLGQVDQGGTRTIYNDDYEALRNKPCIEGNELIGNKSYEQLGLNDITPQEIDEIIFGG